MLIVERTDYRGEKLGCVQIIFQFWSGLQCCVEMSCSWGGPVDFTVQATTCWVWRESLAFAAHADAINLVRCAGDNMLSMAWESGFCGACWCDQSGSLCRWQHADCPERSTGMWDGGSHGQDHPGPSLRAQRTLHCARNWVLLHWWPWQESGRSECGYKLLPTPTFKIKLIFILLYFFAFTLI